MISATQKSLLPHSSAAQTSSPSDEQLKEQYFRLPDQCLAESSIAVGRQKEMPWDAHTLTLQYKGKNILQAVASCSPALGYMDYFWDLVSQNSGYIINLGNYVSYLGLQKGEAAEDCPDRMAEVTTTSFLHDEPENSPYMLNKRKVSFTDNNGKRTEIPAFELTGWDSQKGLYPTHLHYLIAQFNTCIHQSQQPGVIHCHRGIGRTGVIVIASALYQLFRQGGLTLKTLPNALHALIQQAREQRSPRFVESEEQYISLYRYGEWLCSQPVPS